MGNSPNPGPGLSLVIIKNRIARPGVRKTLFNQIFGQVQGCRLSNPVRVRVTFRLEREILIFITGLSQLCLDWQFVK
jgi:hypothetical protein